MQDTNERTRKCLADKGWRVKEEFEDVNNAGHAR
jgi:hypothetical protein